MKSHRTRMPKLLMCLTLGAGLAGTTWAAETGAGAVTTEEKAPALQAATQVAPSIERATTLIGLPVRNALREEIGRTKDIVLTADHRKIAYLAIAPKDGWPENKVIRAPVEKVTLASDRSYITYDVPPSQFWSEADTMDKALPWSQRVSTVLGTSLKDTSQESAGRIRDLLFDVKNHKIASATVGVGGLLGFGEKLASVDWKSVALLQEKREGNLAMTAEDLRSYAFTPGTYWEQLGFVSGEEPQSTEPESYSPGESDAPAPDLPEEPKPDEPGAPAPLIKF